MIIGIPKELKRNEYRVALTPSGVRVIIERGHVVLVEYGAGKGSGFSDQDYENGGAKLLNAEQVYSQSEMIYKVKEILPQEYAYMREGLIVFTYLHTNAYIEMTEIMLKKNVTGIAYSDVSDEKGKFPLLKPMSELAGKGGFIAGLNLMQSINGGNGRLLARIHGCQTPHVTIIGAGSAGLGAADLAIGFGNQVSILDIDLDRLEQLKYQLAPNVELLYSSRENLVRCLERTDLLINCILWDKTRKDHLVSRKDLELMNADSIIVDVACDEHGAIETSRSTKHDDPTYEVDGIVHYAVDNIPSAFSKTATELLSNVTLPYALQIANLGVLEALKKNPGLRRGLSTYKGQLTLMETAVKHNKVFVTPEEALNIK
jgi:alanine dehydrogenase